MDLFTLILVQKSVYKKEEFTNYIERRSIRKPSFSSYNVHAKGHKIHSSKKKKKEPRHNIIKKIYEFNCENAFA